MTSAVYRGRKASTQTIKKNFPPSLQIKYKMSSFKSSENIQKKDGGPDRSVLDKQSSSMVLDELAMKARKLYCNFKLQQRSHKMI